MRTKNYLAVAQKMYVPFQMQSALEWLEIGEMFTPYAMDRLVI